MKTFQSELCGAPFRIWNGYIWGHCFEQLVILWPSYILLAVLSSFYIGYQRHHVSRGRRYLLIIEIRIAITAVLCILSVVNMIGSNVISGAKFFMVDYLTTFTVTFSWLLHIGYLLKLKGGITDDTRGPFKILASFVVCFTSSVINLISVVLEDSLEKSDSQLKVCEASLTVIFQVAYCLTLLPEGDEDKIIFGCRTRIPRGAVSTDEERRPLLDYVANGGIINFETEPQLAESKNIFSKVFFCWLNPLIDKGNTNRLKATKDLFVLPPALKAVDVYAKISSLLLLKPPEKPTNRPPLDTYEEFGYSSNTDLIRYDEDYEELSLFRSLFKCFGYEYIAIGILKFFSDSLAFSGPLLLNAIVSYLEGSDGPKSANTYWYAFALFVSTSLGALITIQYNFQVGRIGIKIRTTIITALYGKILALNKVKLASYSSGQVMNFMSTDSDRIVNFCQSFHQFWSLPVQIIIIFYLLYQEVGFSFVVGLVFALVVILLNQYIAKKIVLFSRQMMEAKDKRMMVINEIVRGARAVKMHAWEERFMKKVTKYRKEEVSCLKKRKYLDALCVYLWATTPLIVAFLTFTTFVLLGNRLSASKIFTSIALFNMLIVPLNAFPWVLNGLMEAWVSLKRIQDFFRLPSLYPNTFYGYPKTESAVLSISEGIFSYGRQTNGSEGENSNGNGENGVKKTFFLGSLNINIPEGKLVCIIGKVGSGKSTLLHSILGDVVRHRGNVGLCEDAYEYGIGFVSQEPWIQRGTIKENILFGRSFSPVFYETVIESCGLDYDMVTFQYGDKTEVGENGCNLSGGQRARVSLARAVYQNSSIYLIDDPFASLDTEVSKHIFHQCILGILKGRTVLLCTQNMDFASKADHVIHVEDGKIVSQGSPINVLKPEDFADNPKATTRNGGSNHQKKTSREKINSTVSPGLQEEEERNNGAVKFKVYKSYCSAAGTSLSVFVLMSCLLMQFFRTLSDWWLSYWVSSTNETVVAANVTVHHLRSGYTEGEGGRGVTFYLYAYGAFVALNSLFSLARAFSFAYAGVSAAVNLHNQLLQKVMKVSLNFFSETPMGRILNRFSSDMYNADDTLPFQLNILLAQVFSLIGCLVVTWYGMSWVAFIFIPLLLIYYRTQKLYRCASRELKRLCSVTLSPLYASFTETLSGHSTIRALRHATRFTKETFMKLDENNMAMYAAMAAVQWLNLRLQFVGVSVVTGIAVTALLQSQYDGVDPGLVGLTLSYALSLQSLLNGSISAYTETEKEMISVERILQYAQDLEPEDEDEGNQRMPYCSWPHAGAICFKKVYLQYRPDRFPVVEAATFSINPGQKIGIIGRTGSGKTTLIMAMLRMLSIVSGEIYIDGLDITRLDLKTLRSRLSVIPQDPFLFDGTVRENLDPCSSATDEEIMIALDKCHMIHKIVELGGLSGHVSEAGCNFSTGEKQLLCLARAILRKSKVVCMDEVTASIDGETEDLVQKTIRTAFASATVIVIAHKLKTLGYCDFIMIMEDGKVADMMTPNDLLCYDVNCSKKIDLKDYLYAETYLTNGNALCNNFLRRSL